MKSFEEEFEKIKRVCGSGEFKRQIEKTKERLSGRPLVLYGAGAVGASAARVLKHYNIEIDCFCDKNKTGIHQETGLPVISPQILASEYSDANIIICSVNYKNEILRDLSALGIKANRIFSREFLNFHEMTYSDMEIHLAGYKRAFDLLYDNQSKQILLERIKCYLTSSPITSSPITSQYFEPEIITLSGDEIFVDGGMYTGDTAQVFFKRTKDRYTHYYGFEPDEKNFQAANENLRGKPDVTLISKGLWSREARLAFSENLTSSSRLDETGGGHIVETTALDAYFQDKTPPTFIKMDIEGAELEALRGAEHIIRARKPKLAICAYHKPEDLYTLPEQIRSCRSDYIFYLRHYTESIYETVLYAV